MKKFTLASLTALIFQAGIFAQSVYDFRNYNTSNTTAFTSDNFKAIAVGKDGHIWAGTQYGGLYKYDPVSKAWSKAPDLSNVFINDIKADKNGGIWIAQSGKSGTAGGGGNIDGGVNYFPEPSFTPINFYSITGNGGLSSRNVRSLWIDTSRYYGGSNPTVWVAQASFITSYNATRGGIGLGLSTLASSRYFGKIASGLDPSSSAIPSCLSIGGNKDEVWVMAQGNKGKSQILRYSRGIFTGVFRGAYDYENVGGDIFTPGFRASAIYFDNEGRQWIGLQEGGVIVKMNELWIKLPFFSNLFSSSVVINNNAITGDEKGNIYIGTNEGLAVFRGGDVSDSVNFEKYTTDDGLPSNYISGIAVDTLNNQILLTTSGGISFCKERKKIEAELAWDYSFPKPENKPKGVAADGVSRLYLKIKRGNDSLPPIKKVQVMSENYIPFNESMRGRLKLANTLDKYSNEASEGTFNFVERTDSTSDGYFWFWYVSPEDFSLDYAEGGQKSIRKDSLKIKVTFADNSEDSTLFKVLVVRPPLVLVHGLASDPSTFDSLKHTYGDNSTVQFVKSHLFKQKKALVMDGKGAFFKNAKRLLSGDIVKQPDMLNTLQGNIDALRRMGYASNQVDYLCHSMGGIIIRGAIGWYHDKFFANGNYKYNNYKKGFVHKLITVNTPHNSSPLADAVNDLIPAAPTPINIVISEIYKYNPHSKPLFDFIIPEDTSFRSYSSWKPSDAVRDLQVTDKSGGVNLPATENVKNHRIAGDVNLSPSNTDSTIAKYIANSGTNYLVRIARDHEIRDRTYLTSLLGSNISDAARFIAFFNWYGKKKGFVNFAGDGDLIVPLRSQTANTAASSPEISLFENPIGTGYNTMHTSIMTRLDVGDRILQLLNSPLNNNPAFVNSINANTDPEPAERTTNLMNADISVTSYFDTSMIVVSAPSRTGITAYADSTLLVKFSLKDTVGLAYININFQGTDSFTISRNSAQEISFKVNAVNTGKQLLMATAVYDKGDSVKYYCDTLSFMVDNLAAPQGFRVKAEEVDVTDKIFYHPQYEVKYNDEWIELLSSDPSINIAFTPTETVGLDTATFSFKALQEGFAQAYISYKGFKDTLSFNSTMEMPVTNLHFTGKVFLQGAYNTVSGKMNTTLNSSGILPQVVSQPYSDTTFNYYGREKAKAGIFSANPTIVDWIMVELRDADLPTAVVAARAAFVKNDGELIDTSGTNGITFTSVPPGNYYIAVKHRNHVAVRSSAVIDFSSGTGNYDFTTALSSAYSGTVSNSPMAALAPGVYGMWGGNVNGGRTVKMTGLNFNSNDYLKLLHTLGSSTNSINNTYSTQDINMDGKVNMSGASPDTNDYLKLQQILGSSINQINQPLF